MGTDREIGKVSLPQQSAGRHCLQGSQRHRECDDKDFYHEWKQRRKAGQRQWRSALGTNWWTASSQRKTTAAGQIAVD